MSAFHVNKENQVCYSSQTGQHEQEALKILAQAYGLTDVEKLLTFTESTIETLVRTYIGTLKTKAERQNAIRSIVNSLLDEY